MKKLITILSVIILFSEFLFGQNMIIDWQQCYGGSETDKALDIISLQGGYLINGWTSSDDGDISLNHGLSDGWLIKIDSNGNIMWEKTYGGIQGDNLVRIFSNFNNEYYLLGASNSSEGDISFDPYPGTWDFWIVKIDSAGNILWDKIVGGNGDEVFWTGTLTDDGGVLAFGWTGSDDGDVSVHYGLYDMWMVKLDSDGEKEWDFTIGTSGMDVGQAIIQTSDGGYLVGGSSRIDEGGNLTCVPHSYKAEAILVKLDADRNIEWQHCYGGSEDEGITGLLEIEDAYVFVAYTCSNDGDVSGFHGTPGESCDIWVVKIDFYGNIIWQNCLGGSSYEFTDIIIQTDDNGFIVTGNTTSFDGDVTGNHSLSEFENDIWLIKLSSEGDLLWQQCIGGIGNERLDYGIIKKSDNNYVIAGQTDYGPSFDVECTPHAGNYPDFWVFEIIDTSTNIINNITNEKVIKIYPNPATDYVVFEIPPSIPPNGGKNVILINDVFGQVVETLSLKNEKTVWDTREVSSGTYFYCLQSGLNTIERGKVVIIK
ncbi:MAG: T9SS type A sorting domain-containing protein [Bacteroidales bacterium]|nr:T9SS type A sorting domain-containing protein [Bacteroidales bacterium]